MNSPTPSNSRYKQLMLLSSPASPGSSQYRSVLGNSHEGAGSSQPSSASRIKAQRRQSSISYTSTPDPPPFPIPRRNSFDDSTTPSRPTSNGLSRHKSRPRPLSLAFTDNPPPKNYSPSDTSGESTARGVTSPTSPPRTVGETYAHLLTFIAQKESKCLELRSQLAAQEAELAILKRKWEKIVARHQAYPDAAPLNITVNQSNHNSRNSLDLTNFLNGTVTVDLESIKGGMEKLIRGVTSVTSSVNDGNRHSRAPHSRRASTPSLTTSSSTTDSRSSLDEECTTTPDTSLDLPLPSQLTHIASERHRRSKAISNVSSPSHSSVFKSSSLDKDHDKHRSVSLHQSQAPLPGPASALALASLLPDLPTLSKNVSASVDKLLSPHHQKRASKVLEGMSGAFWGVVAGNTKSRDDPKPNTRNRNAKASVLKLGTENVDGMEALDFTSSPSHYTCLSPSRFSPQSETIKEVEEKSENEQDNRQDVSEEDEWNW